MEGFGGIVGTNVGGKKTNPGIDIPKSMAMKRRENDHEIGSNVTPANKDNPINMGLLSIVGSGMGGNSGNNVSSGAAKRK